MPLTTFKFRRGTAAQWASTNPILGAGEPGFEIDTNRLKMGNGVSSYNDLEYFYSQSAIIDMLAVSGRLSTASLAATFAAKAVETMVTSGRLSTTSLDSAYAAKSVEEVLSTGRLSEDVLAATIRDLISFGTTVGTVAQGNDARFSSKTLNANVIVESATGVWTDDPPLRTDGDQKIIFIGVDDPADPTNGVDTPSNINPTDTWLRVD